MPEIWSGEKPWTFAEVLITDEGIVAGYSYSQGGLSQFARGELHAVILGPGGTARPTRPVSTPPTSRAPPM